MKKYWQIHSPSYTILFYLSGKKSNGSDSFSKSMQPTKFTETPSRPTTFARSQICKISSDSFSRSLWSIKFTETPSSPTTFPWSQVCKYVNLEDQFVPITDINDNTLYKMSNVVLEWVWLLQALTSTKREPKFFCSPLCFSRVSKRITDSSLCLISNPTSLEFKHKRVS